MTLRVVLAFSGGLKSSAAVSWLASEYGAEVVTVTMDLGHGRDMDDVRERALALGATRAHLLDVSGEYAAAYVLPALQAGAIDALRDPMARALSRPLIAKRLVEIARFEGVETVAHAADEAGGDSARLEHALRSLDPDVRIIAPAREWGFSRASLAEYGRARGIANPGATWNSSSIDVNLWARTFAGGDVGGAPRPPEDLYTLTKAATGAPDIPADLEIDFEQGVPVRANGVGMSLVELIASVETIAGGHGVGRIDSVEHRPHQSWRTMAEAPAAVALQTAHRDLQHVVTPIELGRIAAGLGGAYADLIERGAWFTPTREAIDAFVTRVQSRVTGRVHLKLFKGDCRVVGRESPFASGHERPADEKRSEAQAPL